MIQFYRTTHNLFLKSFDFRKLKIGSRINEQFLFCISLRLKVTQVAKKVDTP